MAFNPPQVKSISESKVNLMLPCGAPVVNPRDRVADIWEQGLTVPAQRLDSILPHIASAGRDQTSKSEVYFLLNVHCFCTIVKSTHCIYVSGCKYIDNYV